MKLNLTLVFTLVLLTLMLAAGGVSARLGFSLGHQALKDVTEPDVRTTNKMKLHKGTTTQPGAVAMLKEEDILASVKKWIASKGKHPKPVPLQSENKKSSSPNPQTSKSKNQSAEGEKPQPGFPIATQNQGVKLEVVSTHYSGGALQMKVNLKNEGAKDLRFLYSFLDVADDQGRELSADTEGLPEELPANGQNFTGTISIPVDSLTDVRKIAMTLTDYPDQQLRLQLTNIPVKKPG